MVRGMRAPEGDPEPQGSCPPTAWRIGEAHYRDGAGACKDFLSGRCGNFVEGPAQSLDVNVIMIEVDGDNGALCNLTNAAFAAVQVAYSRGARPGPAMSSPSGGGNPVADLLAKGLGKVFGTGDDLVGHARMEVRDDEGLGNWAANPSRGYVFLGEKNQRASVVIISRRGIAVAGRTAPPTSCSSGAGSWGTKPLNPIRRIFRLTTCPRRRSGRGALSPLPDLLDGVEYLCEIDGKDYHLKDGSMIYHAPDGSYAGREGPGAPAIRSAISNWISTAAAAQPTAWEIRAG
jgi:hypothetical protein